MDSKRPGKDGDPRPSGWSKLVNVLRAKPQPAFFGRDIESVSAAGRCVLATVFLIVLQFGDPRGGAHLMVATLLYFVFGVAGMACASALRQTRPARLIVAVDVAYGVALLLGGASVVLFIMLYTFAILAAAAQWSWRGALGVGGALVGAFGGAYLLGLVAQDRLLIRGLYMAAAGGLAARAAYDAEVARNRLYDLARWSSGRFDPAEDAVRAVLRHAADILEAEGVVVIWAEAGASAQRRASYWREGDALAYDAASHLEADLPAPVRRKPFVLIDRRRQICLTYDGPHVAVPSVPAAILELPARGAVVASSYFSGGLCEGRLFAFGIASWRWDQLILVEIVARQVKARLDGRVLREQAARHAAERERVRLARDLHDGFLQTLTGVRLNLKLASGAPEPAASVIREAVETLGDEQRKLRRFVEEQRDEDEAAWEPLADLGTTLRAAAARWRLAAAVVVSTPEALLPPALMRELAFLGVEAVANAARHGAGGVFEAVVAARDGVVDLRLVNPVGPDRSGSAAAPRSLADRVLALGGTLAVDVSANQIAVLIQAPIYDHAGSPG